MSLASIAQAEDLYVKVLVAAMFSHACQALAAEKIQMAWRKKIYSPEGSFFVRVKRDFESNQDMT